MIPNAMTYLFQRRDDLRGEIERLQSELQHKKALIAGLERGLEELEAAVLDITRSIDVLAAQSAAGTQSQPVPAALAVSPKKATAAKSAD